MDSFYQLVGLGCFLIIILAFNVSRLRYKERIAHGDQDNKKLRNAMLAHSNAIEHIIPFCLIIYVLIAQQTNASLVQFLVVSFMLARLIHAIGLNMFVFRAWQIASGVSYLLALFSCALLLYQLI